MTKERMIQIHRIYGIALSVVIVIAGILLMFGCLTIYNSGDQPYSREVVAATFSQIAIPVYLCLAMTILSFVFAVILPAVPQKPYSEKPYKSILAKLASNRDLENCDEEIKEQILTLQKDRQNRIAVRSVFIVLCSGIFLFYALDFRHYDGTMINESMIAAMEKLILQLIIAMGYAIYTAYKNEKSLQEEIELMKQVPVVEKKSGEAKIVGEQHSSTEATDASRKSFSSIAMDENQRIRIARSVVAAIAVFCLVYGLANNGFADVLTKAINICTECIGLG